LVLANSSNTLNNFDLGDTRTTHAVVQPIISPTVTTCKGSRGGCSSEAIDEITAVHLAQQSVQHQMPGSVAPTIGASGPPYSRTGNERVEAEALAVTTSSPLHFDTYNQTTSDISFTLSCSASDANHTGTVFVPNMAVRRLTPVECERLQGFPDNWSRISWKGKPEEQCPDGPRYKACGNSMAVPVMRWIGERIAAVNSTLPSHA
jgi:DNA (cytosine-5)-methyltransferase 1